MEKKIARLYGLDLLRCLLMFVGPIIHTGQLFGDSITLLPFTNSTIEHATYFAHPFRMGLFFFISGYFSSLVLDKKGPDGFRESRKVGLYTPLLFSAPITLLVTNILFIKFSENQPFQFHHVWFLIVLGGITLFPYFNPNAYSRLSTKLSRLGIPQLVILFIISYITIWAGKITFFKFFPFENSLTKELIALLLFLPLTYFLPFISGSILYSKGLVYSVSTPFLLIVTAIYGISYGLTSIFPYEGGISEKLISLIFQFLLFSASITFSVVIFFFCMNLKLRPTKALAFVTKSALPFYLIHQPIVFLLAIIIRDRLHGAYPTFFTIMLLTFVLSLLFYYFSVKNRTLRKILGIRDITDKKIEIK